MISALTPKKDGHTIHVRVGRIWEVINKKRNTLLHTNVILLDQEICYFEFQREIQINKSHVPTYFTIKQSTCTISLIITTSQENHIVTAIRNNQRKIYLSLHKEQGVYIVSNFKDVPRPAQYRCVDTDFAINLFFKTRIEEIPNTSVIPLYKFELQPFDKVNSLNASQVRVFTQYINYSHKNDN